MNPIAETTAGLFLVIGAQSSGPLEAERICSALIQKLSEGSILNLDPSTWQNAMQMVPNQVEAATASKTQNRTMAVADLPSTLASICADAADGDKAGVDLAKPISVYLSRYGDPTAFNCFMLDKSDSAKIHLSLTCLAAFDGGSPGSFAVTSTLLKACLNLSNKDTQSTIAQVFGRFGPPSDSPYYLRVLP
ncbi:MAG: glutamate acetyltransferase [Mesorhizobium sp.]|nr:MAG: glutamate acetyltransferase [Mesorhizobium sp.]RWN51886.1 MAG: glutamate acetyltransferase [Mesorhizobium sp.]RWO18575.1 MAG: glutamate acetyltransferase [Mesorhizobium sp.]RWO72099.1 MAG: glutamate acetyltransferase [Mesorhizobium sp.]TIN32388.1 MAG: glutamate acetyltransferase [Mesorhizobium sp.]